MVTQSSKKCPAIFISAPSSGEGKTTFTALLARMMSREGKKVRVFKTGPDYLDPQILSQASKQPVEQLDIWMGGDALCRQKLYNAACESDLIIIEGAMGLFDGEPSSADLAACFNIPLVVLMNVKGMAQTAAALVSGLANFRDDIVVSGMIANYCGSARHQQLIEEALPDHIPLIGVFPRADDIALPERHLGLVQACEVYDELEQRFELGADLLSKTPLYQWVNNIAAVEFHPAQCNEPEPWLEGVRIGIAKDDAFSFIYADNIYYLQKMGARLCYFSPLTDRVVPDVDALWLPGGYPELHARALSENLSMIASIKRFHDSHKPILAECGGFLYCLDQLVDLEDKTYTMSGLICGLGAMKGKRGCQGMQTAPLPEGDIRGHAHHRSRSQHTPEPLAYGRRQRHSAPGEAIYRSKGLTASYLHLYFASNPIAIAQLFNPSLISHELPRIDEASTSC
jgi:cobyrinic acid a,c-diamide synthase